MKSLVISSKGVVGGPSTTGVSTVGGPSNNVE